MISRGDMRTKYHLKGNGCKDCLCASFCQPCDLTQQDKEAGWREARREAQPQGEHMTYHPQSGNSKPESDVN